MDYQEAIESHINECRHRIDVIRNYMNTNGDADKDVCNKNIDVLKIAISAMQELEITGVTGTMTWQATGEVTKTPTAVKIENGVYVGA